MDLADKIGEVTGAEHNVRIRQNSLLKKIWLQSGHKITTSDALASPKNIFKQM